MKWSCIFFPLHNGRDLARRSPIRIKMRTIDENVITSLNVIQAQAAQTLDAKILADKRAKNVAMHDGSFDLVDRVIAVRAGRDGREIAEEAPSEGIACPGGIDHLFQRKRWRAKI